MSGDDSDLLNRGIQQDDNYREFMGWITDGGLRYAYAKKNNDPAADTYKQTTLPEDQRKHVIVVGAGITGLTAAYELAQNGHKVTILEAQSRVGGRIKTYREGFEDGLHAEGGAMRLPYNHFLTRHYIKLFDVETRPFQNENDKGYLYINGDKIRISEWKSNNKKWTDKWFPGWDAKIPTDLEKPVTGILDLYDRTMQQVKDELGDKPSEQDWKKFIEKWSKLSLEDFFRSDIFQDPKGPQLRPWAEAAISAFKITSYTTQMGSDLVSYLREELGEWWKDPMYTPTHGMDSLPKAMVKKNKKGWNTDVQLSKDIVFGFIVNQVETFVDMGKKYVRVSGFNRTMGETCEYSADAVILTLPLNILRQIHIPSLTVEQKRALAGVSYDASTKLMLQCKTRFWQKDVGQGGFSKTDMLIGQLHYPDHDSSGIHGDERGILLVYTWGRDALTFAAETERLAFYSAVKQISKIHEEVEKEFEVGNIQAWFSDPSSQGAYAQLHPFEYLNSMETLTTPPCNEVYLAGEALSWSNGWIQGAIFSGLMAAYSLTAKIVHPSKPFCSCNVLS